MCAKIKSLLARKILFLNAHYTTTENHQMVWWEKNIDIFCVIPYVNFRIVWKTLSAWIRVVMLVYCLYLLIIWHKTSEVVERRLDESDTVPETESECRISTVIFHTRAIISLLNNILLFIAIQLYQHHAMQILAWY